MSCSTILQSIIYFYTLSFLFISIDGVYYLITAQFMATTPSSFQLLGLSKAHFFV